ncbi:hypothetical protein ABIB60_001708 [Hymenobacter sp. UYP22]
MLEFLFEAILAPLFGELFNWLLFKPIGIMYMLIRYRGSARRRQVLAHEYENEYSNVGKIVVLNTVIAVLAASVAGLLLMIPVVIIQGWLNK